MNRVLSPREDDELRVPLDARWLNIPVLDGPVDEDEISSWAAELVTAAADDRGVGTVDPYRRIVLEQMYVAHLELARNLTGEDRFLLLTSCLVPGPDLMPVVTMNLSAVQVPDSTTLDHVVELSMLPEDQRFGAPEVDAIDCAAGQCTRVRQLVVGPASPDEEVVLTTAGTSLLYLWPTADPAMYLVLDAYFADEAEAAAYEDDVDAVARGLTLQGAT